MAVPENPNDGSLLSSIFICADEEAHDRAVDMLDFLQLPNPEEHEHFSGPNVDRIYLNTQGIVLSFVYRRPTFTSLVSSFLGLKKTANAPVFDARTVVDERILQPLYQLDLSPQCCLEVVPGIYRGEAEPKDLREITKELKAKKIHFYDPQREFVGAVRTPDDEQDILVVANRRAVRVLPGGEGSGEARLQDKTYGPLREQFYDAFNSGRGCDVAKAFQECAKIVALPRTDNARVLNAHWQDEGVSSHRTREIRKAANYFQQRLEQ